MARSNREAFGEKLRSDFPPLTQCLPRIGSVDDQFRRFASASDRSSTFAVLNPNPTASLSHAIHPQSAALSPRYRERGERALMARGTVENLAIVPRLLTRQEAAAYCRCESLSAFSDWVRRGILPGPIPGTHKWDKKAIDSTLDRLSGLEPTIEPSPFDQWKAEQDARADQGHSHHVQETRQR